MELIALLAAYGLGSLFNEKPQSSQPRPPTDEERKALERTFVEDEEEY